MVTVFIGVGSNLGDREKHFDFARGVVLRTDAFRGLQCSSVYETDPVDAAGGKFLNAVWSFETGLSSGEVLTKLREIERQAGRTRGAKNGPRTLDLDLLAYGHETVNAKDLIVPHPRMHERWFVLKPFCDLSPDWRHPVLKKTAKELLEALKT